MIDVTGDSDVDAISPASPGALTQHIRQRIHEARGPDFGLIEDSDGEVMLSQLRPGPFMMGPVLGQFPLSNE